MSDSISLPTRHRALISVSFIMIAISTASTVWRIAVRRQMSRWMRPSDWLMILGAMMNIAAISVTIAAGFNGAGRLLRDPFWQPSAVGKMVYVNRLTFASQLLNVYGMWVVKVSICAYLLALNFSKGYRWVIWGTLIFATVFNFVLPVVQHFGLCRPLASRWDIRITEKRCWSQKVRIGIAYTQAISNIVTDLVYATAPIAYIRSVRLSKRTKWSVRAVFLISLICTGISAVKLWDFQRLQDLQEAYYESVTLSIWSMTEVSIGIVVANLPPLRRSFNGLLRKCLSGTSFYRSDAKTFQTFHLSTYHTHPDQQNTIDALTGRSSVLRFTASASGDHESDKAILDDFDFDEGKRDNTITCTTRVTIDHT